MSGGGTHRDRVILSTRSSWDAEAGLPLLHALLDWRPGPVVGVFSTENTTGYTIGSHHKLVTMSGRQVSAPTHEAARIIAKSESQSFRRLLSAAAAERSFSCEFVEKEGEIVGGVCTTVSAGDIAILAQRPAILRPGPVLLIGDAEVPDALGPGAFAKAVARHLSTSAAVLRNWSGEAAPVILGHVNRVHASAIVVDCTAGQWTRRDLQRLLSAARCPVVVFGATQVAL